jgi:mitochondrial fission protein ELM1
MGRSGRPLPRFALEHLLRVQPVPADDARPDLIISSGGKSVFAGRTLSARTGAPYVFLGERKPYPSEWFHTAFTPSASERGANDVAIEMIPTQITAASVERAAGEWKERPAGRLWAMILGGRSASHRFVMEDWEALARGMNELARARGIRWLLTTSRRTGTEAETRLRATIDATSLAYAVWWADKPEKKVAAFLGAAEWTFVTQDSVTMVTEAVASGRPVIVVRPEQINFPNGSFLPAYFENLERKGRIARQPMRQLQALRPDRLEFRPRTRPVEIEIVDALLQRLDWV